MIKGKKISHIDHGNTRRVRGFFAYVLAHGFEDEDSYISCIDNKPLYLEWILKKFVTKCASYLVGIQKFITINAYRRLKNFSNNC